VISAIILAAGRSSRFGAANKLTTVWRGKPLVRHVFDAAVQSRLARVLVVTGHQARAVSGVLAPDCRTVHNDDYADGMAGSIRAGVYGLGEAGPVMILLGDMPLLGSGDIDAMIGAFEAQGNDTAIVVATCKGERGNPVLFGARHFDSLKELSGDEGARAVVAAHDSDVVEVDIGQAARLDFDVPAALER